MWPWHHLLIVFGLCLKRWTFVHLISLLDLNGCTQLHRCVCSNRRHITPCEWGHNFRLLPIWDSPWRIPEPGILSNIGSIILSFLPPFFSRCGTFWATHFFPDLLSVHLAADTVVMSQSYWTHQWTCALILWKWSQRKHSEADPKPFISPQLSQLFSSLT